MAKKRKRKMSGEAVIFDASGRVLLVRQGKRREGKGASDWELPGGKVKKTESLPDAIVREVKEETGIDVEPLRMLGIFYIPEENYYDWVVECRLIDNNAAPEPGQPEIAECKFFPIEKLPKKIRGFTLDRIADAREGSVHPLPIELSSEQWMG